MISESGASFTWTDNSQTHRLTPWSNDPISDPSGEAIYLRDDDDGSIWSPTPQPAGRGQSYLVRHGQGYTTFEHRHGSLSHELTVFVAEDANVKIWRLRLKNGSKRTRQLSAFGYVEWVLGTTRSATALSVVTESDAGAGAVLARSPASPFPERVAFFAASGSNLRVTGDRLEFLGRNGSRQKPAPWPGRRSPAAPAPGSTLRGAPARGDARPGRDAGPRLRAGEGEGREQALSLARTHRDPARAQATLDAVVRRWDEILGAVQVATPDPAFDLLLNRWLLYQTVSCRLWARSAFYQSGGAYGFRDQLQDVLATVHGAPALAREQILRAAARPVPRRRRAALVAPGDRTGLCAPATRTTSCGSPTWWRSTSRPPATAPSSTSSSRSSTRACSSPRSTRCSACPPPRATRRRSTTTAPAPSSAARPRAPTACP